MTKKPDWALFIEDLDEPPLTMDDRAERIADVVAADQASHAFLMDLAEAIRPNGKSSNFRFVLQYKNVGHPPGTQWRVGYEMARLVDDDNETTDMAVHKIQQMYGKKGNSRSKCFAAMALARKETAAWKRLEDMSPD